jgi:hypothetical protein
MNLTGSSLGGGWGHMPQKDPVINANYREALGSEEGCYEV